MATGKLSYKKQLFCAIYVFSGDPALAVWKAYNRWDLDIVKDEKKLINFATHLLKHKHIQRRIHRLLRDKYVDEGLDKKLIKTHTAIMESIQKAYEKGEGYKLSKEEADVLRQVTEILDKEETKKPPFLPMGNITDGEFTDVKAKQLEPPPRELKRPEIPPFPALKKEDSEDEI